MLLSVGESAPFLHICVSVHSVDRKFGNEMKTIKHVAKYIFLKINKWKKFTLIELFSTRKNNSIYFQFVVLSKKKKKRKETRIQRKMEAHLGGLTIKIDSVLTSGSPCVKRNGKMRTEKSIKGERRGENVEKHIQ